jgi:hypothetical protein
MNALTRPSALTAPGYEDARLTRMPADRGNWGCYLCGKTVPKGTPRMLAVREDGTVQSEARVHEECLNKAHGWTGGEKT